MAKNKFGVIIDGEIAEVFETAREAEQFAIEADWETCELVENYWWIPSDYTENNINYIIRERNAEQFGVVLGKTGMKNDKIAELCGKSAQTICLYTSGKRNIPKLVIDKFQELDRLINGKTDV